jgi:hypothetical protein
MEGGMGKHDRPDKVGLVVDRNHLHGAGGFVTVREVKQGASRWTKAKALLKKLGRHDVVVIHGPDAEILRVIGVGDQERVLAVYGPKHLALEAKAASIRSRRATAAERTVLGPGDQAVYDGDPTARDEGEFTGLRTA